MYGTWWKCYYNLGMITTEKKIVSLVFDDGELQVLGSSDMSI